MLLRVVVVSSEAGTRDRLAGLVPSADTVVSGQDAATFWAHPEREVSDLVVALREELPAAVGAAIASLHRLSERPELVVLRDVADPVDTARLLAAGCFAVVHRSLSDAQLGKALAKLIERRREVFAERVRAGSPAIVPLRDMVSRSPATQRLFQLAGRVAASDASLLILGETGTGKDWLARAIHGQSPRAKEPFVAVNCGAVPEHLLESELFGHEKGAFTGAVRAHRGYFELAHKGTLLLDEIAEIPPHLQVKLLRVLQDYEIRRLGGEKPIPVDVRVMAATNRDLTAAIREKTFRQDLYYRLAVVTLKMPALRERQEDLPELAENWLEQAALKLGRLEISGITPRAMAALSAYGWPGNVRELINVVERAVLLCDGGEVDLDDLPEEIAGRTTAGPQGGAATEDPFAGWIEPWLDRPLEEGRRALMAELESRYLERLLARHHGNVGKTAESAGLDPRTVYSKMRRFGLRKESFKDH